MHATYNIGDNTRQQEVLLVLMRALLDNLLAIQKYETSFLVYIPYCQDSLRSLRGLLCIK